MIQKVINKRRINDSSIKDDLIFWLSKKAEERIAAVEFLRRQYHGSSARLQRSIKVIQRTQS